MTDAAAAEFARIPAGEFLMGAADAEGDARPIHRVYVSEFFIGRFPVTHDEYARFVRATGHPPPAVRALPLIASGGREEVFKELAVPYVWIDMEPPAGYSSHPVVLITYADALAYCGWLSEGLGRPVRLPTEAEWEKAARGGVDSRRYPWVSDWYAADYYALSEPRDPAGPASGTMRIVRGGSWVNDDVSMLRCAYRHKVPPDTYAYSIGFRIVCTD
jgi:formylglycine-generating enzyme